MTETRARYLGSLPTCPFCHEPGPPHHPDLCLSVLGLKSELRATRASAARWQAAYNVTWVEIVPRLEVLLQRRNEDEHS